MPRFQSLRAIHSPPPPIAAPALGVVGDSQHRCGLGRLQRLAVGQPDQGCRREVEKPAGTIFISAKPDPIRRRRSEPANNPGTERKLLEARTPIERAGEQGREQRVRVGDVKHAIAADGEASGMAARARHVDIPGGAARLEIDSDHPARPATDAQAVAAIGGDVNGAIFNREPLWVVVGVERRRRGIP